MRYIALLGLLLFFAGCVNTSTTTNQTTTTIPATLDEQTKQDLIQVMKDLYYIQTEGTYTPKEVTIVGVAEKSGVLEVNISVDGNVVPVYLTLDKQYIISGLTPLQELKSQLATLKQQYSAPVLNQPYEFVGPMKGNPNASIVIVEFSDFECPYCKRFYDQTLPQLTQDWIETGKIAFYYRHLPLPFHPKAEPAALASYCAQQQGKFWEAHDWLFENLSRFDENGTTLAQELGLDMEEFQACMEDAASLSYVQQDSLVAQQTFGLTGTPSFIIVVPKDKVTREQVEEAALKVNGRIFETPTQYIIAFSGAYPYQVFQDVLTTLEG
ncbi:MAG: thioredoxin domain-containing protein [Candidatus Micrarchaeota archaeon]|nr:thioredoxin domain-containing protein [Candidatus Micrarchaeota archaeon]